jgi:hypothetical protein
MFDVVDERSDIGYHHHLHHDGDGTKMRLSLVRIAHYQNLGTPSVLAMMVMKVRQNYLFQKHQLLHLREFSRFQSSKIDP